METLVAAATNWYHTSSSALPTQPGNDAVAPADVPATGEEQVGLIVIVVAEEQLSLCENEKQEVKRIVSISKSFFMQISSELF
jgi:hypothetical protein